MYKPINGYTKNTIIEMLSKRTGKGKAVDKWGECQYLAPDGNKCAVGVFLPEGHEGQRIRGDIYTLIHIYPDVEQHMPLEKGAMQMLQATHDTATREDVTSLLVSWVKHNVMEDV